MLMNSVGEGACHQGLGPEFDPQHPQGGKERTNFCMLTSDLPKSAIAHVYPSQPQNK